MSQGPDPTYGSQYPYGQPQQPQQPNSTSAYQSFDPLTGRPLPPGPAAYSAVDPYAPRTGSQPGPQPGNAPSGYEQAGYEQSGYAQPGYPQPGYAQPGYPQPGYPQQPGYPAGYQLVPMYQMPRRPARPGAAVAAAVLAYVQSGFVLIGGISLFSGASELGYNTERAFTGGSRISSELTVVAVITMLAGALLIAGATTVLNRKPVLLTIGCALSLAISVYFVIRLADFVGGIGLWVPVLFAILPIISIALTKGSEVRAWVRERGVVDEQQGGTGAAW